MKKNDFEEFEQSTKFQVIKLEEENKGNDRKKQIVDNLTSELERVFKGAKKAVDDTMSSEEAEKVFENAKDKADTLLERTKKALKDFREDDRVQDVITKINDTFDSIVTSISENETVQNVGNKVNDFVNSDSVQDGIHTAKRVTLDLADKAHDGLKNLLGAKDGKE
ncbi:ElaB/YqjD/DUF883 family membrane-anchored ribosome-binding protein [Breznakia sp. PF5-3]|uniref:hypothetical protein n=1 Tax=unclassified Breznakia TaxID=2623764 RepID=UPI002404DD80|nr:MULTISPECIES: hypothetical protein [unclassified Breznakia]MDF9823886.1 ElaB/YqjD/DUF883 family membrane-anchored ribosome-binding protein [Breznakia sp. PM6-1]MDF9834685.1 ElaB/YqjD/DUF883 family membrane-anchored ribosome-binding protein [Breznakia sp. PF5-3]MDF9836880.1 ElaB/YqjD/DUF883 family membrane-anchored ribosome-binding protein [Breznakia sp. PFB2-8]MDF9858897.1 ElaB/YqjD/DUF883 family membrane-anchored ribosome-binding protein [Breznakia sp. PH5-24]